MSTKEKLKGLLFKQPVITTANDMPDNAEKRNAVAVENPYIAARRTWNAHTGSVVSSRQAWQAMAILGMLIVLASVGGITYIGAQSKFIPYAIPTDPASGRLGTPEVLSRASEPNERQIHAALADFIESARMVTPDIALQRKAVFKVYALLAPDDPATTKMNEFMNGSPEASPFKRAENETVSTAIVSALPQTPDTWQIEWMETTRDRKGGMKTAPVRWRALVTFYLVAPTSQTTEDDVRKNPLRLFVRDFSWSKQL